MNIYLYPNHKSHAHDGDLPYHNTTPMSAEGIIKHCKLVGPDEADFFYMGQITDVTIESMSENEFTYINQFPKKHMLDLEGDWHAHCAPNWVINCIKSGNATKKEHYIQPFCIRPAMSYLLVSLGRDTPDYVPVFPENKSFGFKGFADLMNIRSRMAGCIRTAKLPAEIEFNYTWCARQDLSSRVVDEYMRIMIEHIFALCPRGMGMDTIRFYEACFFARVPVLISDMKLMGEDYYDTSFVFHISPYANDEEMTKQLIEIYNTPMNELIERGKLARQYFLDVVVNYFQDPTLYFINFLKRNGVYTK